jgi:hypothetical protein
LREAASWAPAGHEIAWGQFPLQTTPPKPERNEAAKPERNGDAAPHVRSTAFRLHPVSFRETRDAIEIICGDDALTFDRVRGVLASWTSAGVPIVSQGPKMQFWRAPIDNDRRIAPVWREHWLHRMQHRVNEVTAAKARDGVEILVQTHVGPPVFQFGFHCLQRYTFTPNGILRMAVEVRPRGTWPEIFLPRVGIQMVLPFLPERVTWYGLGPGENYADSREAARVGLWHESLKAMHTSYIKPQENGNRGDVRLMALRGGLAGPGLIVTGDPLFGFSAQRFSTQDLESIAHNTELKLRDQLYVNVDHRQLGLGSNSCGPLPLEQYLLKPGEFKFALEFAALNEGEEAIDVWRRRKTQVGQ